MRPISRTVDEMCRPVIGHTVFLVDGRQVGTVTALNRSAFRLTNSTGSVWLSQRCIFTVDGGHVTLICGEEGIRSYIVQPYRRRELQQAVS
jgi:hypothetical protein